MPAEPEPATVEESPVDLELLSILRKAAEDGSHSIDSIVDAVADAARVLSGADGTALGLESKGTIACRARSGNIAPELGAPINTKSGISGECLRLGAMLVCHDALTDPRVDNEVCRMLGIRSVAAVPLRGRTAVAGILEAFASRPDAFDGEALRCLRELAEIAEIACQRQAPEVGFVVRPLAPAAGPARYTTPLLAAEDILGESQTSKKRLWYVMGAAAALLITVAAWWGWHTPADEVAASASVRPASAQSANVVPSRDTVPKPAPGVLTGHPDRSRSDIVENAAELKPIELAPERSAATGISRNATARTTPIPNAESDVPAPPSVNLAASANQGELDRLTSVPTLLPAEPPRISQGVVEATLIHRVAPLYPLQARSQRLSGKVTLTATIGSDGSIRKVVVIGGSPVLAAAAQTAVQQWRYSPAKLNGTPVEVQKEITIVFTQP